MIGLRRRNAMRKPDGQRFDLHNRRSAPSRDQAGADQQRAAAMRRIRSERPMERVIQLHIEKLPEGVYLATSDEVQGLVAQGRTIQETIEIARDAAKKLIEAQGEAFDYPR
jgi:predicted RNase H-like HicB family nuclease